MSEFAGLVKAKKEDIESALSKWDKQVESVQAKYNELLLRAKEEFITTKLFWLFPIEQSKAEYLIENSGWDGEYWTMAHGLNALYPEEFPTKMVRVYNREYFFDDIKALYQVNPDEVYLSSEQASRVVSWK